MCTGPHDFIPADKVARMEMVYSGPGGVAENVLNFEFEAQPTLSDLEALTAELEDWHSTLLYATQSEDISLILIRGRDLTEVDGSVSEIPVDPVQTGGIGSRVLPSNATLAMKQVSGFAGRSKRGRTFHIGLTELQVVGDAIVEDRQADLLNAYDGLLVGGSITVARLVVVSYCNLGNWRAAAAITPVNNFASDWVVDSQRRRLAGRGI